MVSRKKNILHINVKKSFARLNLPLLNMFLSFFLNLCESRHISYERYSTSQKSVEF